MPALHRRISSSLLALDQLSPPSPLVTPSSSLDRCASTSGEIPIMFSQDNRAFANEAGACSVTNHFATSNSLATIGTLAFGQNNDGGDSFASRNVSLKRNRSLASISDVDSVPASPPSPQCLISVYSAFGISSFLEDTFDYQEHAHDLCQKLTTPAKRARTQAPDPPETSLVSTYSAYGLSALSESSSRDEHEQLISTYSTYGISSLSQDYLSILEPTDNEQEEEQEQEQYDGCESHFTISAYLASPSVYGDMPYSPALSTSGSRLCCNHSVKPPQNIKTEEYTVSDAAQSARSSLIRTSRSLSTIQFNVVTPTESCINSPSYSPPTTPISADRTPTQAMFLRRQLEAKRKDAESAPTASNAYQAHSLRASSSASELVVSSSRYLGLEPKRRPITSYVSHGSIVQVDNTVAAPLPSPVPYPVPCLRHAQWLRDTVVELWIDQEGFRAIRPQFFLASISNALPSKQDKRASRGEDPLFTTVAEFLPLSREMHLFHHAALDRGPTLNRITANGDEARDYITRQASLSLRDNGVFYVHGTEDHKIGGGGAGGAGPSRVVRLKWRFEYFVSTRRPGTNSTKVHSGERVFKPLSFSCTPALLDRNRASKVTVLHIMKKTILPNIVSQKLEPPDLPQLDSVQASPSIGSIESFDDREAREQSASPQATCALTGRRRKGSLSESIRQLASPKKKSPAPPPLLYLKHRRGSHSEAAGHSDYYYEDSRETHAVHERSKSASYGVQRKNYSPVAEHIPVVTISSTSNIPFLRPIIPQAQLSEMFGDREDIPRGRNSVRLEVIDNVRVTVLPPAPRPRQTGF